MTPTEQDKELRRAIVDYRIKCDYYLSDRDEGVISQEEYETAISGELDSAVQLITADRKRVALAAFDEGYEAGRKEKPPKLVDAVEFRRESYGWSKGKMAAMLDMTKGNYSEFIHGTRGLPVNSIRKAYAIGIPAQVLLQDDIDRQLKAQQEEL